MKCVDRDILKSMVTSYVSLVVSRVNGLPRVRLHEEIAEATGIPYDELKQILWHLEEFGYDEGLEDADWEHAKPRVLKIAEEVAGAILAEVERRVGEELRNDCSALEILLVHGYDVERWIEEWKENGWWLCGGDPALSPDRAG